MNENKNTIAKEVEDTLACTAFAEAGEDCPIGTKEKIEKKESASLSLSDTMACSAFAEAGEDCPICVEKKS